MPNAKPVNVIVKLLGKEFLKAGEILPVACLLQFAYLKFTRLFGICYITFVN